MAGEVEEILARKVPKFDEYISLYIQEAQWTPWRINSEHHTKIHHNQSIKRQRENPESTKTKVILNKIIRMWEDTFKMLKEKDC